MPDNKTVIEVKTGEFETKIGKWLDEDLNWSRYKTVIGRNSPPTESLERFQDLSNTHSLEMKVNIDGHLYDVNLPEKMMARLSRYLSDVNYPFDSGKFDCVCFVNWMLDEPYEYGHGVNLDKYDMERLQNDWDLKPGDVIHMSPGSKWGSGMSAEHAMVYIGHGLYLSKPGDKNGLSVQKLYQLQEMYGDCNLFRQKQKELVENG